MIHLEAGPARLTVVPGNGGRLGSLVVDGVELLVTGDPDDRSTMWGVFPMAPWAGRLAHGRFRHDGITHQLAVNEPPHAIHGTVATVPWVVEATAATAVTLTCALGDGWPLGGTATHRIELGPDELRCTLRVTADDRSMPAALGWHPWFRTRAPVRMQATAMYERGADDIPTGRLVAPAPPPWNDFFVTTEPVHVEVAPYDVAVATDCDHVVVFDELDTGTAIEPQSGPPDALNLQPAVLAPGEALERTMTIRWQPALPTRG